MLQVVTPIISFMLNSPKLEKKDFSSIRSIGSGAAPVGNSLIHGLLAKADNPDLKFIQVAIV